MLDAAEEAAERAQLVVLPEASFPAYVLGDTDRSDDAVIAGAVDRLRALAKRTETVFVVGAAARVGEKIRNGALVIDRNGDLAGRADKLFLWHFDRRWFEAGDRIAPVDTSVGRLGVLVCADGRIPTIARALVDDGAEILVMPTAWVTSGRNPMALENVQADLLGRVRAYENGVPFVAANKCGTELGMVAYCGKSQIVSADGTVLSIAGEHEPEIAAAAVDVGEPRPHRSSSFGPVPAAATMEVPCRLAIACGELPPDAERRLEILGDEEAITPGVRGRFPRVGDDTVLDPGGLVPYRRAGHRLFVWTVEDFSTWTEAIARARALELRVYVVVLAADRAFVADPDGVVIAGTFGDYRLASFLFDPRKANETTVAPETDVAEGLERVAGLLATERAKELS
jgi:predicted amidohydrolase